VEALIFVLIGLAVAAGIWLSYYVKRKRRQDLQRAAAQLGLQFSAEDTFGLVNRPFELFDRGDGRGCENVMWGTWKELDVTEFDYWYYEQSSDSKGRTSRTYHRFSSALIDIDALCPHLTIGRETFFTRMADHFGFRDIEFESEEFNRAMTVQGTDPKFATDLIDARMMRWLLEAKGWSFELHDRSILCFGNRQRPDAVPLVILALRAFRDHIPRVVWELYRSPSPGR
jgi:hypothetical protein